MAPPKKPTAQPQYPVPLPDPSQSSSQASSAPGDLPPWSQAPSNIHNPTTQDAQRRPQPIPHSATTLVPGTPSSRGPGSYTWTEDQNTLLFNIALEKAESDLAHGKLRDAAELAAMGAAAIAVRPKTSAPTLDEDEYTGEIPNEVKLLASQFAGLPQGEIAKIFANKFRPMNLHKLRHMRGCDDMYRDHVSIEEGTLKMRKVTCSYKDYGQDNVLWSQVCLNYTMILMELFGATTPPYI